MLLTRPSPKLFLARASVALTALLGMTLLAGCQHSPAIAKAKPRAPQSSSFLASLPEEALEKRAFMQQPKAWFVARLDEPQVVIKGQKLHPKLQYEFQERRKERAKSDRDYNEWLLDVWSTPEGRASLRQAVDVNWVTTAYDAGPVAKTKDLMIPGGDGEIRIRVYWPEQPQGDLKPALLYFHGGGFLFASIEAVEPQAMILANMGDLIVVSVDYSLAPEHPFPAAQKDAIAAYEWLQDNAKDLGIDPERIGVAGDSAGGNLAVIVSAEMARRGENPPKAQLLYYPFLDMDFEAYESFDTFGNGFGLDKDFIRIATDAFLTDPKEKQHPWLNLLDTVDFAEQPPTVIATAGFDPIRDQGFALARALEQAGVKVIHKHYPSLNHGFLEASAVIDDARQASFETARLIGKLLHRQGKPGKNR